MGGLAVYAGVLAGLTAGLVVLPERLSPELWPPFLAILVASTAIVALGFLDDIRSLTAPVKLLGEIAVSVALWSAGLRIEQLQLPGFGTWVLGEGASLIATVLWLVAVTNAFNLIDGVNGLAGGVAGITATGLLVLGRLVDAPLVILLAASLAGAVLAFLRQNLRRGGIFLGDSGSLFLGFLLAATTLELGRTAGGTLFPGAAFLLMGLPLVEVGTTVVRRTLASRSLRLGPAGILRFLGRDLMCPDAGHLHHCLIRRGLRAGASSAFLIGTAFLYCLASVSFFAFPRTEAPAYGMAVAVTAVCLGICRPLTQQSPLRRPAAERRVPELRVLAGGGATAEVSEVTSGVVAPMVARQARAAAEGEFDSERLAA
jgi:UDP-GlcNAc:undecaprenyl-phosphate GlcNAc-1-phosphate transferase